MSDWKSCVRICRYRWRGRLPVATRGVPRSHSQREGGSERRSEQAQLIWQMSAEHRSCAGVRKRSGGGKLGCAVVSQRLPRGMVMFRRSFAMLFALAIAAGASALLAAAADSAKMLRIATAFDPNSLDPHSQALLYHTRIVSQIYESLITRDQKFLLEPQLATSWQQLSPALWRFKLRPNVVFHDGTPFTADDAIFSLRRAREPTSQREFQLRGLVAVRKVDSVTIDCELSAPDAVFPDKLLLVAMMSKSWSEQHGVEKPQDYNGKQETYAVRNANGTGPFLLVSYEQDVKVVLAANPKWWGRAAMSGNVDRVEYSVIKADATRLAALASGQVDLVLDPTFQDVSRLQHDPKLHL